ncbi:hypothetical protein P154DRAFT_423997 [Amniculicola lignicola CBS 123094]|uniref:Zn(2)-C6 fungal-type domain-containing protein n=1 Tax=Amniculicola lignicola CBS 123094 TaxID=1392246 RepID=A0A6A5WXB7_9PLEO|nr:hypothetical protein P154DRAFT_423997 [Amniculicola lignicola CBS 123094]
MATPRRKACVECRQQKIRCDVEQNRTPHDPCGRCRKMDLECRILPTSTRNLRQTKAEMRRELEELRWNIRGEAGSATGGGGHMLSTPTSTGGRGPNCSPGEYQSGSFSEVSGSVVGSGSLSPGYREEGRRSATVGRSLDGYSVEAKKIEDCFTLFFGQYHPLLPILDPVLGPNEYYESSPFLFWSIIVTGSRRYSDDPTILDRASQLITPLAFSSMALRSTPMAVIQGLLILCTWRLPTNSMYKDMTHVLCGAAVHLATQIGLHVAGVGQDFARMPLKENQEQKVTRARIWMQCVVVSIRSSCIEGIPPLVIAESSFVGDHLEREDLLACIPNDVLFQHKVHVVLLRALSAMVRTDLNSVNCDISVLRSLIGVFDLQLVNMASSSTSDLDTFQLNCARIHILCFHFYAYPSQSAPDAEALCCLYSLCVSTIKTASTLAQNTNLLTVCPSFIERTLTLTGFAILKISRSPLAQHLDLPAGEQAYFSAVQFSKSMSLQNNDLGTRTAAIMTNLWSSTKAFKRKDGHTEALALRLRTRLSMSVSFDMFWYWREEFGNMSNPYNGDALPSNFQTRAGTPQYVKQQADQAASAHSAPVPTPAPVPALAPVAAQPAQPAPTTSLKFDPTAMAPTPQIQLPPPGTMGMDSWDGTFYDAPPMLDQFPDYDWAASFDFSTDWPNVNVNMEHVHTAGFNFG